MKKSLKFFAIALMGGLFSCQNGNESIVPKKKPENLSTNGGRAEGATPTSSTTAYWVDFNPNIYANEFWTDYSIANKKKAYGSCFAASVVLVENYINSTYISATAVKEKNAQMTNIANYVNSVNNVQRYFYNEIRLQTVINRFQADKFTCSNIANVNRQIATNNMIDALKNKKWVIGLAGYMEGGPGHAYPIYSLDIIKKKDGSIDENLSIIKVVDSYDNTWQPYNNIPKWSSMYKTFTLKSFLDKMFSTYKHYWFISVKK